MDDFFLEFLFQNIEIFLSQIIDKFASYPDWCKIVDN